MLPNNPLTQYFRQPAIYIKLPSQGKFYPPGTLNMPPNGELPVLPMTSNDEITYRTPDALFNGTATVNVIRSCVPSIRDPWTMPAVDIDAVLVGIRIASYGHGMDLTTTCPSCKADDDLTVDLRVVNDTMKIGNYDQNLVVGDLEFWFQPIPYKTVNQNNQVQIQQQQAMRVVDSDVDEQVKMTQITNSMAVINETTTNTVAQSIAAIKTPAAMVTETEFIVDYLRNCDSKIFNQLKNHIVDLKKNSEVQPLELTCKECNHHYQQPFTLDLSSFFDNAS
jgi:hypothetical protein